MKSKPFFAVLQEELHKRQSGRVDITKNESFLQRAVNIVSDKTEKTVGAVRRRIAATKILGPFADIDSVYQLEARMKMKEEEMAQKQRRREYYYRFIAIGYLDMTEAIIWRYEVFSKEDLTLSNQETLTNLFNSGKLTMTRYARWLALLDEESFIETWIEAFESIDFDTFKSMDKWVEFFESLPLE